MIELHTLPHILAAINLATVIVLLVSYRFINTEIGNSTGAA